MSITSFHSSYPVSYVLLHVADTRNCISYLWMPCELVNFTPTVRVIARWKCILHAKLDSGVSGITNSYRVDVNCSVLSEITTISYGMFDHVTEITILWWKGSCFGYSHTIYHNITSVYIW